MKINYGVIGIGGGGGSLANTFVKKFGVHSLYINSSDDDYSFDVDNFLKIGGYNGLSRRREKANSIWETLSIFKEQLKESIKKEFVSRNIQLIFICTSTSGGTGSGFTPKIYKELEEEFKNIKFVILATLPYNEKSISYENSLNFILDLHKINANYSLYEPKDLKRKSLVNRIADNDFSQLIHSFLKKRDLRGTDLDQSERLKLLDGFIGIYLEQYHITNNKKYNIKNTSLGENTELTETAVIRDIEELDGEEWQADYEGFYNINFSDDIKQEALKISSNLHINPVLIKLDELATKQIEKESSEITVTDLFSVDFSKFKGKLKKDSLRPQNHKEVK